jgi:regulator of protease activity HflC (stomatin/prohibitin superfamily)
MTLLTTTLLFAVLALVAAAVKRVPAGQVQNVYRHGKPVRLLQPGTHMVLPLLDRVGHRIDLGGRMLRIDQADQLIRDGVIDALHADTDATQDERREVAARLKCSLNKHLRERGVMVTRVELEAA